MWWAYSPNEYLVVGAKKTSIWRPLWDSVNYCKLPDIMWMHTASDGSVLGDFAIEIFGSMRYFFSAAQGKSTATRAGNRIPVGDDGKAKMNFAEDFGVSQNYSTTLPSTLPPHMGDSTTGLALRTRPSYDEDIRLAPYTYGGHSDPHSLSRSDVDSLPSPTGPHFGYSR